MNSITIGFVPRERFAIAATCLERLFAGTRLPFHLIVVDGNIPARYRAEMDAVLRQHTDVETIALGERCLPNRSRNLVIERCRTEYLCLIENDVVVEDGWLETLLGACENEPADVAAPLIIEGPGDGGVHFDWRLDRFRETRSPEGVALEILPKTNWDEYTSGNLKRKRVDFVEQHCMLLRRKAYSLPGLFDEALNTRMEIDMSLVFRQHGVTVVFEPASRVHFLAPDAIEPEERDYFERRWNLDVAEASHSTIDARWNLVNVPDSMPFVQSRLRLAAR